MKIIRVLSALLLVSIFATPTAAHERANKSGARSHIGSRSPVDNQPQAYGIEGRDVIAPPWSAACPAMQKSIPVRRQCTEAGSPI